MPRFTKQRTPDYTYLATKRMGKRTGIVEKVVKGRTEPDTEKIRTQATTMMMKRLFEGASNKQLAVDGGVSEQTVDARIKAAKQNGVPEAAREIFIKEFLPKSLAVLQEALASDDLQLATRVALKVVEGLEIMEDPTKATVTQGEPESLEVWRAKFVTKKASVEGVVVKQLPSADVDEDLNEERGSASHTKLEESEE